MPSRRRTNGEGVECVDFPAGQRTPFKFQTSHAIWNRDRIGLAWADRGIWIGDRADTKTGTVADQRRIAVRRRRTRDDGTGSTTDLQLLDAPNVLRDRLLPRVPERDTRQHAHRLCGSGRTDVFLRNAV